MSAEIKSVQNQNEERTGFRSASIAQVDWKGTKREFEKLDVSIGNTEGLDLAIRKYSEVPEENLMMSVAVLVSFAVVGIAAIVAAIYASFVLAPVILVGGYLALAIPLECMASRESLGISCISVPGIHSPRLLSLGKLEWTSSCLFETGCQSARQWRDAAARPDYA